MSKHIQQLVEEWYDNSYKHLNDYFDYVKYKHTSEGTTVIFRKYGVEQEVIVEIGVGRIDVYSKESINSNIKNNIIWLNISEGSDIAPSMEVILKEVKRRLGDGI